MAVSIFIVLVAVVALVWAGFALMHGSREVADERSDLTAGHRFPSENDEAPSLLEDDLSFANRHTKATRATQEQEHQQG